MTDSPPSRYEDHETNVWVEDTIKRVYRESMWSRQTCVRQVMAAQEFGGEAKRDMALKWGLDTNLDIRMLTEMLNRLTDLEEL